MGNKDTIANIDTPRNDKELTFSLWYDIVRQYTLKLLMPNFAIDRVVVARLDTDPEFGYSYQYAYPNYCLKVLGIGEADAKRSNFAVEGNKILTNVLYEDGLPLRIIRDITDVSMMSSEFIHTFALHLADATVLQITQNETKSRMIKSLIPTSNSTSSALNAQENPPIRISNSRFKAAKYVENPTFVDKK